MARTDKTPPQFRLTVPLMVKGGKIVNFVWFEEFGCYLAAQETSSYIIPLCAPTLTTWDLEYNVGEVEDWSEMTFALMRLEYIDDTTSEFEWSSKQFVEDFFGVRFGRIPGTEAAV